MTYVKNHKKVSLVVVFMLIACSVAAAAWLITGHGPGRARLGTLVAPTVTAGSLPATPNTCTPGGDCSGYFNISNPNGPMIVTGATVGDGTGAGDVGCPLTNLTVNVKSGLSISVPSGNSTIEVPNVYHLASTAPTACQGGTVTLDANLNFSTP